MDYQHKPHQKKPFDPQQGHHSFTRRPPKKTSSGRYWIYPLLAVATVWIVAQRIQPPLSSRDSLPQTHRSPGLVIPNNARMGFREPQTQVIPGGIKIQADASGHFRGTLYINQIPMPFMVDTGATNTTVPINLANSAQLPPGQSVEASTAGGKVYGQVTVAKSLKIGNAELKNLMVMTNPHLDEVLLGMNTLRHFQLNQNGSVLTLVAVNAAGQASEIEQDLPFAPAAEPPAQARQTPRPAVSTQWKRTTVCDNGQNCRAVYGHQ